jgi:hypothetical protein
MGLKDCGQRQVKAGSAVQVFVSPDGLEANDGSFLGPWPLNKGLTSLEAGDTLLLRGGTYLGNFVIRNRIGTPANPIIIRSNPGERATVEARLADFAEAPNQLWDRMDGTDEYVSRASFPVDNNHVARGSFISSTDYVRLITHSTLEDLRASNQRFGAVPAVGDFPDGPEALTSTMPHVPFVPPERRPWVYMGPGLFHDSDGHIHVRLSATSNGLPGFPAYAGETDPNQLPLAIWTLQEATVKIEGCSSVYLSDITIRYGRSTVKLEDCTDVRLDHVTVESGSYGAEVGKSCHGTVFSHCRVDGGMPSWYFRSDRKDSYFYRAKGSDGSESVVENSLGASTVRSLMFGADSCTNTTVTHCEFVNGHDVALFGTGFEFSRNWINNINDDALFAETEDASSFQIFENVFTQCLVAISLAKEKAGNGVFVYRNLIDLRSPTAKVRPRPVDGPKSLHHGQLFKGNQPDGPIDFFHNTVVLKDQTGASSFAHFRSYHGESRRRAFNNIFVAVNSVPLSDIFISYLPSPTWPSATDGNCFFRLGPFTDKDLLHHNEYDFAGSKHPGRQFKSLIELRGAPAQPDGTLAVEPSEFFIHSQTTYPPGYEASSISDDPRFQSFDATAGVTSPDDDFRLSWDSPARQAGVELPEELSSLHQTPPGERPAIGCFQLDAPPLMVGVDGRHHFHS